MKALAGAPPRRVKLGIVTNELFAEQVGRMGGFGWAVRQVSESFQNDPELGVDVVLLMGERPAANRDAAPVLHGAPVIWPVGSIRSQVGRLRREGVDLLLSIDYRSGYRRFFYALPRVPIVVWVRDPWTPEDRERLAALRIPGETVAPQGTAGPDPRSLRQVVALGRLLRRRVLFGTTAQDLIAKIPSTYAVSPAQVHLLPNIVVAAPPGPIVKSVRPLIVFLARLDPIKRPWIFAALAKQFAEADFIVMGQSHFHGAGAWQPNDVAPNLRFLGHTGERQKQDILSAAWLLVSTSMHEGLSVSFLEALAREVPIVAATDPEKVASRFGAYVGWSPGTGLASLPAFEQAVRTLLENRERRVALGGAGRRWVEATHSRTGFLRAFSAITRRAGVRLPPSLERYASAQS
jgi:glycosyltransferase involved in cell wall biosynthesis